MRAIVTLLTFMAAVLPATESNPRVSRVIDSFSEASSSAQEAYEATIRAAEEARAQALNRARERALRDLKRLVNRRSDFAEQAQVYTQVLRLDREDDDAVTFFTAIGTLDNVLEGLEPLVETDLLGNVVAGTPPQGPRVVAVFRGSMVGVGYIEQVPDSALSASTSWRADHSPDLARFSNTRTHANWSAQVNDAQQWIQVDLGAVGPIGAVATMGRARENDQWLTAYRILLSDDGNEWREVVNPNGESDHLGNSDNQTPITHILSNGVRARFVRLAPIRWHGHISTRFEVYAPGVRSGPDAILVEK